MCVYDGSSSSSRCSSSSSSSPLTFILILGDRMQDF